jgi:glc operon protein GlcG
MRTKHCLTLDDTTRIVTAAKAEAVKNNWTVTIVVVDDSGILLHLERLDGATAQSPDIAILKARAAALGRMPSKALEDIVKERPALLNFPNRAAVQGGLPISYKGEWVGGIGVSGVKSHEDEQVAQAGLAAF